MRILLLIVCYVALFAPVFWVSAKEHERHQTSAPPETLEVAVKGIFSAVLLIFLAWFVSVIVT